MIASTPNPAWPLRSDAENAGRALALRAALDFALSPQQQRRGMLPTEERVLELADKFAAWLQEPADKADAVHPNVCASGKPVTVTTSQIVEELRQQAVSIKDIWTEIFRLRRDVPARGMDPVPADIPDEAEALEAADPVIDAYIESDKRVIDLTKHTAEELLKMAMRVTVLEDKVAGLVRLSVLRAPL